jgi:hypothetical protein
MHFNIILQYTPVFPTRPLSLRSPHQNPVYTFRASHACHMPCPPLLDFLTRIMASEGRPTKTSGQSPGWNRSRSMEMTDRQSRNVMWHQNYIYCVCCDCNRNFKHFLYVWKLSLFGSISYKDELWRRRENKSCNSAFFFLTLAKLFFLPMVAVFCILVPYI